MRFYRRPDGCLIGYTVSGHSGYDEEGHDIVCAAVSALSQTILNGLVSVLGIPCRSSQDDRTGRLECEIKPEASEELLKQAQLLLKTLQEGFESIQNDYPQHVRIIFKERR